MILTVRSRTSLCQSKVKRRGRLVGYDHSAPFSRHWQPKVPQQKDLNPHESGTPIRDNCAANTLRLRSKIMQHYALLISTRFLTTVVNYLCRCMMPQSYIMNAGSNTCIGASCPVRLLFLDPATDISRPKTIAMRKSFYE